MNVDVLWSLGPNMYYPQGNGASISHQTEKESHRLKSAPLSGDMLVPWREIILGKFH